LRNLSPVVSDVVSDVSVVVVGGDADDDDDDDDDVRV